MKDSLLVIINNLVADQSKVSINEVEGDKSVVYEVRVASEDMGKVIGKEGKIAHAIRTIMKALGSKEGKKVTIEFID